MGTQDTVAARRFLLQDASGVVRAVLGVNDEGEVLFALNDAQGHTHADISVTADGLPRVELLDSAGNTRAVAFVDEHDSPSLALFDGQTARLSASVLRTGPFLALMDEQSNRQVTLAAGEQGAWASRAGAAFCAGGLRGPLRSHLGRSHSPRSHFQIARRPHPQAVGYARANLPNRMHDNSLDDAKVRDITPLQASRKNIVAGAFGRPAPGIRGATRRQ
jgi:hypothetical protein